MPALIIEDIRLGEEPLAREVYFKALDDINANVSSSSSADIDGDLFNISKYYSNRTGCAFLVGKYKSLLVATGALWKVNSGTVELKRLAVHPDYQRRGFGRQMLQTLEHRANLLQYNKIILDTSTRQIAARSLYEAEGYIMDSREAGLFYFSKNLI